MKKKQKKLCSAANQYKCVVKFFNQLDHENKFKILEVGAGSRILKEFLSHNIVYHSLDIGESHDFNFNLDKGKLPIQDNVYDFVVCTETLEHVLYPERVIKEIKRVAKKNALFFFSLPNEYNFVMRIYYLLGKKTFVDEPFQIVEKHLHIHKPRVKDIINLFAKHFHIDEIYFIWQSRKSMSSLLARKIDKLINILAKVSPSLFCRTVVIKARNKEQAF
ncbi:methyltransferase domain-containing protein [Candidatus Pacearchaeota archaeon]|nr:methyltransferase domain-containing protein [Candidatus Pacearchaeota archaeon]